MEDPDYTTLTSEKHIKDVISGLQSLRKKQLFCDVSLQSPDGAELWVHKILLMSCSNFFHSHFTSECEDGSVVQLEDASHPALSTLLDFVYTGSLQLSSETVDSVLLLADKLQFTEASNLCHRFSQFRIEEEVLQNTVQPEDNQQGFMEDEIVEDEANISENGTVFEAASALPATESQTQKTLHSPRPTAAHVAEVDSVSPEVLESPSSHSSGASGAKRRKPVKPHKLLDLSPIHSQEETASTGRAKRKCVTPKRLQDFTTGFPEKAEKGEQANAPSKPKRKGRGRPRKAKPKVKDVPVGEKKVKSTKLKNEVSSEKKNKTAPKRNRGRPASGKGKTDLSKKKTDLTKKELDLAKMKPDNANMGEGDKDPAKKSAEFQEKTLLEDDSPEAGKVSNEKKEKTVCKTNRKRRCRRCNMEFDTLNLLEKHRLQCRKVIPFDRPDKYKRKRCVKCQIEFPDFASYQEHRKIHLKERNASKKPHYCDICNQNFRYDSFLACHRYSKHKIPFDESKYNVLTCSVPDCGFATLNKWRYRVHSEQHGDHRPFVCDVCGKTFKVISSLATHKKIHTEVRQYECEECGKMFLQPSGREQHIKRIHKKEKSFLCHLCPYKCFVKTELLQHLDKDHSIPIPKKYVRYKCELCDFMTFRRFHFLNHMNMHEGNRMYECELCHKKYTSKVVLRCHMQFHKEPSHKCPWEGCKYAAVQKRRLDQHIQLIHTHKDVKPYECHICGYKTALNGNLRHHLRNVHHLDIPKRKLPKRKGETPLLKKKTEEANAAVSDYGDDTSGMMSINRSDIVSLAVASCEGISPVATPQEQENDTETVVIYTTDSQLPAQVTAAQVLQQLSSGNPLGHVQTTAESPTAEAMAIAAQTDTIVHLPEHTTDGEVTVIKNEKGEIIHRVYGCMTGEVTHGLGEDLNSGLTTEIHIPVSRELSQEARHSDLVSRDLHSELVPIGQGGARQVYIQGSDLHDGISRDAPRDLHLIRDMQLRPGEGEVGREIHTASDIGRDPQRDSGLVIQEMMNAQYNPEQFLPDSRNLNLMIQTMENREGFPAQQNTYWTQY